MGLEYLACDIYASCLLDQSQDAWIIHCEIFASESWDNLNGGVERYRMLGSIIEGDFCSFLMYAVGRLQHMPLFLVLISDKIVVIVSSWLVVESR